MRRNTISEGVAAPLPGNRLSALPTNTQLDTAPTHQNTRTLEHEYTRTLVTLEHQNTEGPVHSGAPLILHAGALQMSTRALAQLGTRTPKHHNSRADPLVLPGGALQSLVGRTSRPDHSIIPDHHTTHHTTTPPHNIPHCTQCSNSYTTQKNYLHHNSQHALNYFQP